MNADVICSTCGQPIYKVSDTAGTFGTGLRHKVCPVTSDAFIERFGHQVFAEAVPNLVRLGYEVWSYQYGQHDNDDPGTFTTIEVDDLDAWDEDPDDAIEDYWGPFAVTPDTLDAILASGPFLWPAK